MERTPAATEGVGHGPGGSAAKDLWDERGQTARLPLSYAPKERRLMPTDHPSKFQRALTWVAVVASLVLLVAGIAWHGFSLEVHQRFWDDVFGRLSGPMTFRFFLQPTMALIAALPDGINDARHGHSSFFWTA